MYYLHEQEDIDRHQPSEHQVGQPQVDLQAHIVNAGHDDTSWSRNNHLQNSDSSKQGPWNKQGGSVGNLQWSSPSAIGITMPPQNKIKKSSLAIIHVQTCWQTLANSHFTLKIITCRNTHEHTNIQKFPFQSPPSPPSSPQKPITFRKTHKQDLKHWAISTVHQRFIICRDPHKHTHKHWPQVQWQMHKSPCGTSAITRQCTQNHWPIYVNKTSNGKERLHWSFSSAAPCLYFYCSHIPTLLCCGDWLGHHSSAHGLH